MRRRARRAIGIRRVRAGVDKAAAALDEILARFSVLGRGVVGGDNIGHRKVWRDSSGGLSGIGCVGEVSSPGTSLFGTGGSFTPKRACR